MPTLTLTPQAIEFPSPPALNPEEIAPPRFAACRAVRRLSPPEERARRQRAAATIQTPLLTSLRQVYNHSVLPPATPPSAPPSRPQLSLLRAKAAAPPKSQPLAMLLQADELDPLPHVADEGYARASEWQRKHQNEAASRDAAGLIGADFPIVAHVYCRIARPETPNEAPVASDATLAARTPRPAVPAIEDSAITGRLLDVSMSGLALQLPSAIPIRTKINVRLSQTGIQPDVEVVATVLRCQPATNQGFRIVCRLHRYLTAEQIQLLGDPLFFPSIV